MITIRCTKFEKIQEKGKTRDEDQLRKELDIELWAPQMHTHVHEHNHVKENKCFPKACCCQILMLCRQQLCTIGFTLFCEWFMYHILISIFVPNNTIVFYLFSICHSFNSKYTPNINKLSPKGNLE